MPRPRQAVSSDPGTHWNNCWDPPFPSACPAGRSQASCVWHPQPRALGAYWECPLILQAQLPQGVLRAPPHPSWVQGLPLATRASGAAPVGGCCLFWITRSPGHCLGGRRGGRPVPSLDALHADGCLGSGPRSTHPGAHNFQCSLSVAQYFVQES